MSETSDVAAALSHVYWLGGSSGAAKSTIARRLAAAHDMTLYSTDDAMGDHGRRSTPEQCPRLEAFKHMTMDQRWADRTPDVMLETFHWYQGEGFQLIVEDILALPRDRKIVVEGFRLLPQLVKPLLASPHQAIWLIATPQFRRDAFEARGTLWEIPNKTSRPEKALQNLLARDAMFAERLEHQAEAAGVTAMIVDGHRSEAELLNEVVTHFKLPNGSPLA